MSCFGVMPPLTDGSAGDVLQTMTEWAAIYHDCRIRHEGLVEDVLSVVKRVSLN